MSESLARSSVSSAVISFVVEAIERRSSALVAQATAPVETSITIALGASTLQRGGRSAAPAADGASAAASEGERQRAGGPHCGIRIRWPGREQLRIEIGVGLLELLERHPGLLGDARTACRPA